MIALKKIASAVFLILTLLLLITTAVGIRGYARLRFRSPNPSPIGRGEPASPAITKPDKHKGRAPNRSLKQSEVKEAEARLSEMGYGTGPVDGVIDGVTRNALIAFQKWEGRKVTGRLSREDFDAIMSAEAPQSKDSGYRHVEVDLDRQVLLLTDSEGAVKRILPVSTGSDKHYSEKGMSGLAYTPRGRFRVYAKLSGWKKSPLGLLYYPNYFSDGLAIHGNPSVPQNPQSHGCIRIPMLAAAEMSRLLPVGTIVLIYDKQSFVSAKEWAEADKQKQEANIR
jgi:peptidoglycan hydrolase-like protein with peptidoglycan-binding domain